MRGLRQLSCWLAGWLLAVAPEVRAATSVFITADPGDWYFAGRQYHFTGAEGEIGSTSAIPRDVRFAFKVPDFATYPGVFELWLQFRPPGEEDAFGLLPGAYSFDSTDDPTAPWLDVARYGYSCMPRRGSFVVHELRYASGPRSVPTAAAIDFEADCTIPPFHVRGALRYRSGDASCVEAVDGTSCDDHDPCTTDDVCATGVCAGHDTVTPTCADPGSCRGPARCDPTSGACSSGFAEPGTPCTDDDVCTENERCDAVGQCLSDPTTCPVCEACMADVGCRPAAAARCYAPDEEGNSTLRIDARSARREPSLSWRFHLPTGVSAGAFQSPLVGEGYSLCIYDETSAESRLAFVEQLPNESSCTSRACWRWQHERTGVAITYEGDGSLGTVRSLRFDPLTPRGTDVRLTAAGSPLSSLLPLATPARVQLRARHGPCFEGRYVDANKSGARRFVGRAH